MRVKASFVALLGLLLYVFSSAAGWAQTTGTLRGTVTDPSGAVVPGASVTVIQSDTHVGRATTANESGDYEFPALPVGRYSVGVHAAGFKEARFNEIEVRLGPDDGHHSRYGYGSLRRGCAGCKRHSHSE